MNRIAVIGNAGGGKSTLCRQLSRTLGIPSYAIDQIQWEPGWTPAPYEKVKAVEYNRQQHDHILAQERWIIDGWGSFDLIEARFRAADTIIFVDLPLATHYWWTLKRQFACLFAPREDGPEGCPMLPMTWTLLKMIWNFHRRLRPALLKLINSFQAEKRILHITSPRELRALSSNPE